MPPGPAEPPPTLAAPLCRGGRRRLCSVLGSGCHAPFTCIRLVRSFFSPLHTHVLLHPCITPRQRQTGFAALKTLVRFSGRLWGCAGLPGVCRHPCAAPCVHKQPGKGFGMGWGWLRRDWEGSWCRHQFGLSGPAVMAAHIPFAGGAKRCQPLPRDPRSPWRRGEDQCGDGGGSAPVRAAISSQHPKNGATTHGEPSQGKTAPACARSQAPVTPTAPKRPCPHSHPVPHTQLPSHPPAPRHLGGARWQSRRHVRGSGSPALPMGAGSSRSLPCHPAAFVSARRLIGGGERQSLRARSPPAQRSPGRCGISKG